MDARAALKIPINMGKFITTAYLEDLTDEEMLHRPAEGCNHIKWQFGHLISAENQLINSVCPGAMPDLPEGFADNYSKEKANIDDPNAFHSKAELIKVFEQQRSGTLAALDKLSDDDLEKESPEAMRQYAPNVAAVFEMQGSHYVMHAGQWAVIRRQLGRPPLF